MMARSEFSLVDQRELSEEHQQKAGRAVADGRGKR